MIGVSLGPGDPGLLTLKAVEVLRSSKRVFVPGEIAASLAELYCSPEVLDFPMIEDRSRLEEVWAENADLVAEGAVQEQVAFACLGDVNTFSTFSHLARVMRIRHPLVKIETVPGVSVIPAMAGKLGIGLESSFLVSDGSPIGAIIRIKANRPRHLAEELQGQGYGDFALGVSLYMPEEQVIRDQMPERSSYFSVLYAHKVQGHRDEE